MMFGPKEICLAGFRARRGWAGGRRRTLVEFDDRFIVVTKRAQYLMSTLGVRDGLFKFNEELKTRWDHE